MKLAIGMPWYDGPDIKTFAMYEDFFMYLGQLRERTIFKKHLGDEKFKQLYPSLPLLHEGANPTLEDLDRMGKLDIALIDYSQTSLVGKARELIVEEALGWGADYLFTWDADMLFDYSSFLKLWRHNLPVVAALAFTARPPYYPVIMKIVEEKVEGDSFKTSMNSHVVFDYPKNKLISNADVEGSLAFGMGMVLYDMSIFKIIPQPWFASTGCGEDFFFCTRCHEYGVPRHLDTSVKTAHKKWDIEFIDEDYYDRYKVANEETYIKMMALEKDNVR